MSNLEKWEEKRDNDQGDRYTFPPKRLGSAADARVVILKQLRHILLQGGFGLPSSLLKTEPGDMVRTGAIWLQSVAQQAIDGIASIGGRLCD